MNDLRALLREVAESAHQTGSIRDHVDVSDKTGWNVRGIETCGDPLCVDVLAALSDTREPDSLDVERLADAIDSIDWPAVDDAAGYQARSWVEAFARDIAAEYKRLSR